MTGRRGKYKVVVFTHLLCANGAIDPSAEDPPKLAVIFAGAGRKSVVFHQKLSHGVIILSPADCLSSPCQNGGSCFSYNDGYRCNCAQGYTGAHCENAVPSSCVPNPCSYGGTCLPTAGGVRCLCPQGYHGDYCQYTCTGLRVNSVNFDE